MASTAANANTATPRVASRMCACPRRPIDGSITPSCTGASAGVSRASRISATTAGTANAPAAVSG